MPKGPKPERKTLSSANSRKKLGEKKEKLTLKLGDIRPVNSVYPLTTKSRYETIALGEKKEDKQNNFYLTGSNSARE